MASSCSCSSVLPRFSRLLFFQQLLARSHDVAALLVQLDDADFDLLALHAIEIAHRPQVNLRAGQKGARAHDVHGQAALDAVDDPGLHRSLVVVGLLDLVPGLQALRLLVREIDVAFLGVARFAHDGDFVAALHRDVALGVGKLGNRNDAFGFVADVHHHVLRRDLQYGAGDDLLFVERSFGLGLLLLEAFESRGEVFHAGFFFGVRSGRRSGLLVMSAGIGCLVSCGTGQ